MSILRNFLKRLNSEEEEVESGKKIKVSKSVNNFEKNEKMFCANWNEMHSTASQTTNAQPPLQTSATQTGNLASSLFVSSSKFLIIIREYIIVISVVVKIISVTVIVRMKIKVIKIL